MPTFGSLRHHNAYFTRYGRSPVTSVYHDPIVEALNMTLEDFSLDEQWPGTPVPHLLTTNNPPSDTERAIIWSVIGAYKQEIDSLSKELELAMSRLETETDISEMSNVLKDSLGDLKLDKESIEKAKRLIKRSRRKERRRNQQLFLFSKITATIPVQSKLLSRLFGLHLSALSSLRHFPPELLAEIFLHVRPVRTFHTDRNPNLEQSTIEHSVAYNFSQVCVYWRQVALNTAALWVDIPTVDEVNEGNYHHLVSAFLVRSNTLPIHIVVSIAEASDSDSAHAANDGLDNEIPHILSVLLDHSYRWRTAVLYLRMDLFHLLPPQDFLNLERLNILGFEEISPFPHRFFASTPVLRQVISDGLYGATAHEANDSEDDRAPRALMAGIYNFAGIPTSTVDLALARDTLQECTFRGSLFRIRLDPENNVRYSQLRRLHVECTNPREWDDGSVFEHMETPVLETLVISGLPEVQNVDLLLSHLLRHTLPSASLLRRLVLHIRSVEGDTLMIFLRATPVIEELDVELMQCAFDDWKELLMSHSPRENMKERLSIVPRLESLVIRNVGMCDLVIFDQIYRFRNPTRMAKLDIEDPYTSPISISLHFMTYNDLAIEMCRCLGWDDLTLPDWFSTTSGSENSRLCGWATMIMKQFVGRLHPEKGKLMLRGSRLKERCMKRLQWDESYGRKLDQFFQIVEHYKPYDYRQLEITGLLQAMQQLADLPPEYIWKNKYFDFKSRAGVLTKKWCKRLLKQKKRLSGNLTMENMTVVMGLSAHKNVAQ